MASISQTGRLVSLWQLFDEFKGIVRTYAHRLYADEIKDKHMNPDTYITTKIGQVSFVSASLTPHDSE